MTVSGVTIPDAPSDYPEKLIEQAEDRTRMSTFQRDELLTQSEILEKETFPPAKEADQHSKTEPDEAHHGQDLSQNGSEMAAAMLLISRRLEFWRTTSS